MLRLKDYDYILPKNLIAHRPASPRDSARLFVYDTKKDTISFDTFRNVGKYLPHPALLVMNDTKVVPARLWLTKETGGKIEVLLHVNELQKDDVVVKGIVDRKIAVGAKLYFKNGATLEVVRQEEQFFFFKPSVRMHTLFALLESDGETPIPPYIKNSPLSETTLRTKYQSVLAKHPASIAAPTASLHFTSPLLERLKKTGVMRTDVTLHVGAGTFAPIDKAHLEEKKLFSEYYSLGEKSASAINDAKTAGIPVIPVGTTAMRTIESAATRGGRVHPSQNTKTNIFIYPPYDFCIADGLITNFHVPRSSLMLLVDAFLTHKNAPRDIIALYRVAIEEKFRFYSFGDAMLIL